MSFLNEYTFAFIAGWILPSALIGLLGDKRLIGFWKSILVSILLSPVIGLIAVLASKSRQTDALEKAQLGYLKNQEAESISSELGKLNALYSNGVIDEEEFKKAKSKILS